MLWVVDNTRRQQLAWLETIRKETGWNWSELARQAGVVPQTFSKFRNDAENKAVLDTRTVEKIAAVAPIPHYQNKRGTMPEGFDEGESTPFEAGGNPLLEKAVTAALSTGKNLQAWTLRTTALENAGYRIGDVLIVDAGGTPKDGDVVCAQIYDQRGGAETAFRLYHKPFLVAASSAARFMIPRMIDQRVDLRGVVVGSLRGRLSGL